MSLEYCAVCKMYYQKHEGCDCDYKERKFMKNDDVEAKDQGTEDKSYA